MVSLGAKLSEFLGAELGTSLDALNLASLGTKLDALLNPDLGTSLVSMLVIRLGAKLGEFLGARLGTSLGALNVASLRSKLDLLLDPKLGTSLVSLILIPLVEFLGTELGISLGAFNIDSHCIHLDAFVTFAFEYWSRDCPNSWLVEYFSLGFKPLSSLSKIAFEILARGPPMAWWENKILLDLTTTSTMAVGLGSDRGCGDRICGGFGSSLNVVLGNSAWLSRCSSLVGALEFLWIMRFIVIVRWRGAWASRVNDTFPKGMITVGI